MVYVNSRVGVGSSLWDRGIMGNRLEVLEGMWCLGKQVTVDYHCMLMTLNLTLKAVRHCQNV